MKTPANEATVTEHEIINSSSGDCPDDAEDEELWDLSKFKDKFAIKIISWEGNDMEFDMIGINASIANAFRRILLSEVPTMAIEKVRLYNNTSILQDEFLAHRLGLIPIRADASRFDWKSSAKKEDADDPSDTLLFSLKVRCISRKPVTTVKSEKRKSRSSSVTEPASDDFFEVNDGRVLSKHIKWMPLPGQEEMFAEDKPRVVHDDILVAKLSAKQELDIILSVVKGVGQDHAKFSPVSTASYRLLPKIEIVKQLNASQSERLVSSFSRGVMEMRGGKAVVVNARMDQNSRNHYRHDDLKDAVRHTLVKDHFIFSIESTGSRDPEILVHESFDILMNKCNKFLELVTTLK